MGIVGRTGAGKSSLVVALTRLYATKGTVLIDGVDVSTIGLARLRKAIAVIPQDPLIMPGSVRFNLDPFNEHSDAEIFEALRKVGLPTSLISRERTLSDVSVEESGQGENGGFQLSLGERQLLSIARVFLRDKLRIVLLDEPTSSIDPTSDAKIQKIMNEEMRMCTTLTIAHRINTIIRSDKILVMDKGVVAEFGAPGELLANPDGIFTSMVKESS